MNADLARARTEIRTEVGSAPVALAYPFGAYGASDDDRTNDPLLGGILHQVVAANYEVAFDQDDQANWGLATCGDPPHHLHRLEVGNWTGRELLSRIAQAAASFNSSGCTSAA